MIKEKYVLEFQRLYEKIYKEKITHDEALKQCTAMVNLCKIVYKPITQKDIDMLPDYD